MPFQPTVIRYLKETGTQTIFASIPDLICYFLTLRDSPETKEREACDLVMTALNSFQQKVRNG